MANLRSLQDPFSELWKRLCEARRRGFAKVRDGGSAEDAFLSITQEERRALYDFMKAYPEASHESA